VAGSKWVIQLACLALLAPTLEPPTELKHRGAWLLGRPLSAGATCGGSPGSLLVHPLTFAPSFCLRSVLRAHLPNLGVPTAGGGSALAFQLPGDTRGASHCALPASPHHLGSQGQPGA